MDNREYSSKHNLSHNNNSAIRDFSGQSAQSGDYYNGTYQDYEETPNHNFYYNYSDEYFYNGMQLNPRQIFWIRRRKLRRDALDASMIEQNKNYTHESRHMHAMNRLRAPSGRFLTKEESVKFLNNIEKKN